MFEPELSKAESTVKFIEAGRKFRTEDIRYNTYSLDHAMQKIKRSTAPSDAFEAYWIDKFNELNSKVVEMMRKEGLI